MPKYHFTDNDFKVFDIDGLESRMDALKSNIRPKLENLGEHFSEYLTELTGEEQFAHVAKHARRTTNPPDDTWVSFSTNPRGYKMMPHFQIGLFGDHAFCMYGVIYESPDKKTAADKWLGNFELFREFPQSYQVSLDHMKPAKTPLEDMSDEDLEVGLIRLKNVKKGEFLVGKVYQPDDEAFQSDEVFVKDLEAVMDRLVKLY
ncbi:YktB family protein [Salinicoccus sp. HZC-1]|uniref:YktB family protein n=1 Tax=Salinicoccus sp. HZC-1 TaxID=3385497 RepID=UPI00398B89CC